ncbi:alanine--tRNA ligase [Brumicola pallidula]|jgi:alanyl-tRNA synthetase|uniref:Alanine--tRNA ligase n=1 Tax=Brumicola pallidula DSM 14239 = ACAM 615 TaxID=1121922 RepID=K7A3Q7_9ALTE|nr:alanine--tRNA ligase [Glaciecola pallidula]GAC30130.1 alanyl-tRNA synthetase [Glaciecola pallidula DSM 14239 = ACAM 615]
MVRSTAELRRTFFEYFQQHQHHLVSSSSLVPHDDPTLLFTNAGMNQFKDVFLGAEQRNYTRAVSSQRCVRAGGKHNDLENVGYTARHHTFFEMLGNFSFGDYFKEEAIKFAWQFLTGELGLDKDKLLVTVYHEDDEAFDIWEKTIGIPAERIIRIATADNFWSMGDTGPCGPCSEIFYDHGAEIWGGPPGSPEEDGDRFIEIWNLVFMQFNRQKNGDMLSLPKPSIDTGMGLERISAILQGVHSNYEIDLFQSLIAAAAEIVGSQDLENKSLRVIADHIRSCSFLICDGVMPSNEGRGYVLRRIIRRAVRHGYKMGADDIFFYKLVNTLVSEMGDAYPELVQQQAVVEKVLKVEEEQFSKTLERGMAILNDALSQLEGKQVPGELVFKLYDTFGFPADLTNDVAREQGLTIDEAGFETAMAQQKSQSQSASKFGADYASVLSIEHKTEFTGYTDANGASTVMDIIVNNAAVTEASDEALILLKRTPFYAESGGQVGDTGFMSSSSGKAHVIDTVKLGQAFAHKVKIEGVIKVGDKVELVVDQARRDRIKANHSATHLLHAALRHLLGDHVAQKGSLVDAEKLRFDFSHFDSISAKKLLEIENLVNAEIRLNNALTTQLMELDEAKASGAMALFGEKYDEKVRVVKMGEFSTELCGGTHVARTGDIGLLKIISEGGIASGVRRIEATTGQMAQDFVNDGSDKLHAIASLLKSDKTSVVDKVSTALQQIKLLEKELNQLKQSMAGQKSKDVMSNVIDVQGVKLLVANMQGIEPKALRGMMDDLKNQLQSGIIALGVASDGKVNLIAGVTKDLVGKFKAGDLVNHMASQVGGKGGGRPDMAQAGGTEPENLDKALASVKNWLEGKV